MHYASMADALAVPASERLPNTHPLYTTLSGVCHGPGRGFHAALLTGG